MSERVAILTNMPAPYRLSFLRELARRGRVRVVFDTRVEPDRDWIIPPDALAFPHTFAATATLTYQRRRSGLGVTDQRHLQIPYGLLAKLVALRPTAVVSAELGLRTFQAALYCTLTRTPLFIWWEGTPHTEGWAQQKARLRRFLVRQARWFWTNGKESTELLAAYGADCTRVTEGMTGVDTRFFMEQTRLLMPDRERIRADLGVRGVVLLFVGRFVQGKGLSQLLRALSHLYDAGLRDWSIVFAGSGPLDGDIHAWQRAHPDVPVVVPGFLQLNDMPRVYAVADLFVLPTLDDNWPLVSLEAVASGLPQLFSRYSGGTADLLVDGRMGMAFDPLNEDDFAEKVRTCVARPLPRLPEEFVHRLVARYDPVHVAQRAWHSIRTMQRRG